MDTHNQMNILFSNLSSDAYFRHIGLIIIRRIETSIYFLIQGLHMVK